MTGKKLTVLVILLFILTACGKEEYQVEYGIEGSIYKPQRLQGPEGIDNLKITGDYLYYTQGTENTIWRVSVEPLRSGEGRLDFSQGEQVVQVPSSLRVAPEYITEALEEGDFSSFQRGVKGEDDTGNQKNDGFNGVLSLEDYAVDPEQNIYYFVRVYGGDYSSLEDAGGILCRRNKDGEHTCQIYLPDMEGMAIDGAGRAYILTEENIRVIDDKGSQLAHISLDNYGFQGKNTKDELFEDSEGRVYYSSRNEHDTRKGYEIVEDEGFKLEEIGMFGNNSWEGHFTGLGGKRILCSLSNEMYEYDRESDALRKLFSLSDSGLSSDLVRSAAHVTEDRMLLAYGNFGKTGLYLLTRTSIDELEEEYIVIASVRPSIELEDAVSVFNMLNDQYKVIIDDYGSEYSETEGEWKCQMLDASLVSGNPPDILDLDYLNIWKYARKGVLEDLYPYLEESSTLSTEDFLDNVLEGLTIDDRLTCIPGEIEVKCIFGKSLFLDGQGGWTFEDVCRLAEEQPADGPDLFTDGCGLGWDKEYLLEEFCAVYYLDAFVDWEKNKCDFDNEEFRSLLAWVEKHAKEPDYSPFIDSAGNIWMDSVYLPEETLLVSVDRLDFLAQLYRETQCGSAMTAKGFPTVDGREKYPAVVHGVMAITSNSSHKEGAWKFLEYYLSKKTYMMSANKNILQKAYEDAVTPEYSKGVTLEELQNGILESENPEMLEKGAIYISKELIPYYVIPQEQADTVMRIIESADFTPKTEEQEAIIRIVKEEAESYYCGDKSLEEVTRIIQNRAQLLLNERKK